MTVQDTLQAVRAHEDEFIALRRDIHQHPELPFEELRTSDLVAARLRDWGYHVERGLGGTGVVGQLQRGDGKRTLGLRADMDALPIQEATGLQYASRNQGVMHACGHDGHTAMLLAAAKVLAEQGDFSGTLNLIFQPAEEYGTSDCGAVRMINDGLFDKYPCDAVFSMHNMPGWPQGHLIFREGPMMASSDKVYITLVGHGGHGAVPHKTADPVVAAASLVMALQTVVSRNVDPLQTAVVTVGVLQSGRANNVIPDSAYLELSVRALDSEVRSLLQQRITEITHAQAQSFGVKAEIDYRRGYAALVNSKGDDLRSDVEHATRFARRCSRTVFLVEAGPFLLVLPVETGAVLLTASLVAPSLFKALLLFTFDIGVIVGSRGGRLNQQTQQEAGGYFFHGILQVKNRVEQNTANPSISCA